MRKGFNPQVLLNEQGDIIAIATGSDACAEHECGSREMQNRLCDFSYGRALPRGIVHKVGEALGLRESEFLSEDELIAALRKGWPVEYPTLLERKTIRRNLSQIVYQEGTDKSGAPVALVGYAPQGHGLSFNNPELSFGCGDGHLAGAWDERGFAFAVRGKEWVAKLAAFASKLRKGQCLFAGTFLVDRPNARMSGVVIAAKDVLEPADLEAIAHAQAKWETDKRLQARSRINELNALFSQHRAVSHVQWPGHLWPLWKAEVDGEVVYGLNPGHGVDADYYGPYTFEQLEAWMLAETKQPLRPIKEG